MKRLIPIFFSILFSGLLYSPGKSAPEEKQLNRFTMVPDRLQTGDVILRSGKGFISEIFRKSSRHLQQYSHAGIIMVVNNRDYVFHVIGSAENSSHHVELEPISKFCSSENNRSYAIYRYEFLLGKEASVKSYLDRVIKQQVNFDEQFDLTTDSALYCTELIYKMCLSAADHKLPVSQSQGREYIALDDIYRNGTATLITEHKY